MNLCKTCGTICPFDDERTECDAYAPMTNENWFISLSTEEKAEWLSTHLHCGDCDIENRVCAGTYSGCKETFVNWLKAVHK